MPIKKPLKQYRAFLGMAEADNLAEEGAGLAGKGGFSGIGTEFEIVEARGGGRQ